MMKITELRKKNIRLLKILFCAAFMLICAAPVFMLDNVVYSFSENRRLATLPDFYENGKIGDDLGKRLEEYMKDHFPWRLKLIKFYYHFQYAFLKRIENEKAFVGDDGWMFGFYRTRDNRFYVQEYMYGLTEKNMAPFLTEAQKRSIDVYFFLVPERAQIYHQYWDKYYARRPYMRSGDKFKETAAKYSNIEVFYPYEQLEALSKQSMVFHKNDIHLYGKAGLQPLVDTFMQILQAKYFPNIPEYPKVIYGNGPAYNAHYSMELFLDEKRKGTTYEPASGAYASYSDIVYDNMTEQTINPSALSDKSVLVIGNCYAESLFAQLREVFARTILYRYNTDERSQTDRKLSWDDIDVVIVAVSADITDEMNFLKQVGDKL
ncbi:MAG: hypothetical protein VZR95_08210 [Alphaproteobacteria bacterium]